MQMPKDPKWSTSQGTDLRQAQTSKSLLEKVVKGICVVDTTYGSFGDITDFTLSSHLAKTSYFQLSSKI